MAKDKKVNPDEVTEEIHEEVVEEVAEETVDEVEESEEDEMLTAGAEQGNGSDEHVTAKSVVAPTPPAATRIDGQYFITALRFLAAKALSPSEIEDFALNFPELFE